MSEQTRFFDFPLAFLGSSYGLPELPFDGDPHAIRLARVARERTDVYSHFRCEYVYEVRRRPDYLDFASPAEVPDWEAYETNYRVYAQKKFAEFLVNTIRDTGSIFLCSTEYDLHGSNWNQEGRAPWKVIKTDEIISGRLKDFPWGNLMPAGWWDLRIDP